MGQTTPVELRLLGPIGAQRAGGEQLRAVGRQQKRLALLAHLVLTPGPHRRQTLLTLFWPELDESAGRAALRQALHHLRKSLGDDFFENDGFEEIRIAPGRVWCDAVELERAFQEDDLEAVVGLYRGDLLSGVNPEGVSEELERAVERARATVRGKAISAMRRLAEVRADEGDLEAATALARRALDLDPLDEVSARFAISILDRAGDRTGAIALYREFSALVAEELSVDPSVETQEVVRRIRARHDLRPDVVGREPLGYRLPQVAKSLVGRGDALADGERVLREGARLVTLTGPAGVGKSRLALALAERVASAYPDGAVFVPLDAIEGSAEALSAVDRALGSSTNDDDPLEGIRAHLAGRRILLVLDGADRVVEAAATIAGLLPGIPGVDAIATSRTPLGSRIEQILPVRPLTLPAPDHWIGTELPLDSEAVALFMERARAADPSFVLDASTVAHVRSVVQGLDGLPLAIELAAARLRHLPIEELARGLGKNLDLLADPSQDRPDRHHSLAAAIAWTDDLLSDDERETFHRVGVFAGEFGVAAAEALGRPTPGGPGMRDLLAALVDHGLLDRPRSVGEEVRFRMLRTTREHALSRLGRERRRRCLEGLTRYYENWALRGFRHWCTDEEDAWSARIEREYPNLATVLDWATRNDVERAAGIATAIYHFWWTRGQPAEGRRRLEAVLRAGEGRIPARLEGRMKVAVGAFADLQGDAHAAREWMRAGQHVFAEAGDRGWEGWALQSLSNCLIQQGDLAAAECAATEALAIGRELENPFRVRVSLRNLAEIAIARDQLDRAEELLGESLEHETGDRREDLWFMKQIAEIARRRGDVREALSLCEQIFALAIGRSRENDAAYACQLMGDLLSGRSDSSPEAYDFYRKSLSLYRKIGNRRGVAKVLIGLAEQLGRDGRGALAARILAGVRERRSESGQLDDHFEGRLRRALADAEAAIGATAFRRECLRGRRSSLDQLVDVAEELRPAVEIPMVAR